MSVKIGILGMGTVGSGTAQTILASHHPLCSEIQITKVGIRNLDAKRNVSLKPDTYTTDLASIVTDPNLDIIVELIGGIEPARSLILTAIKHQKHIVTANKALIARHGEEIFKAAHESGVYVLIEASVAGGIPIIHSLKQALISNQITQIIGIINGTTNYILTRMHQEAGEFHQILTDAQKLGYAEADPSADIDGLDAADKIAILASLAFNQRIDRQQIYSEGIRPINPTDISYAQKLGFIIKLLAIATQTPTPQTLSLRVHPTLVPLQHPLANIHGVFNAIFIQGTPIGEIMFYGPGAGAGPTASAVVSDILNIVCHLKTKTQLNPLMTCSHQNYAQIAPIQQITTRFYTRFLTIDRAGVIGKLGTCFGNHQVSLESIVQTGFQKQLAEIVVVTHDVLEANFRLAINELQQLDIVESIPSIIRVL